MGRGCQGLVPQDRAHSSARTVALSVGACDASPSPFRPAEARVTSSEPSPSVIVCLGSMKSLRSALPASCKGAPKDPSGDTQQV